MAEKKEKKQLRSSLTVRVSEKGKERAAQLNKKSEVNKNVSQS